MRAWPRGRRKRLAQLHQQTACFSLLWKIYSLNYFFHYKYYAQLAALMQVNTALETQDAFQVPSFRSVSSGGRSPGKANWTRDRSPTASATPRARPGSRSAAPHLSAERDLVLYTDTSRVGFSRCDHVLSGSLVTQLWETAEWAAVWQALTLPGGVRPHRGLLPAKQGPYVQKARFDARGPPSSLPSVP